MAVKMVPRKLRVVKGKKDSVLWDNPLGESIRKAVQGKKARPPRFVRALRKKKR